MKTLTPLTALSPVDGRYAGKLSTLRPILSEFGLMQRRVRVEMAWLIALAEAPQLTELQDFSSVEKAMLRGLAHNFDESDGQTVKTIEAKTNHDVKAIEYWIKAKLAGVDRLEHAREFVHFALTSEDVNNLAYALMLKDAREDVLLPQLDALIAKLAQMASDYAELPMLARTHGQPASPTTLGKELANVVARLQRQRRSLASVEILGKLNGATGNFNAHSVACPEIDWPALSASVVTGLGLVYNPLTTQIEPHDWIAEYCDAQRRIGTILIDLSRDIWGYISLGYFKQARVEGEVGSSTMPHKVNPIDFENAEGNLGIAGALLTHFAEKLPISRWQRDLSDSTVLRALGTAIGHVLVAYQALDKGLGKLSAVPEKLAADLDGCQEILGEAIQTVMRRYGLPNPYEQLKELTRGAAIGAEDLRVFVDKLDLPAAAKSRLAALTPAAYVGLAAQLTRE
jgi:adenylosuccinate lyase